MAKAIMTNFYPKDGFVYECYLEEYNVVPKKAQWF